MITFLEKIADYLIETSADNISETCLVFPNRRAGLYLKKYLSQKLKKNIWSPSIFSIEDFVCHITGFRIADPTTLLFDFYNIYKKIEGIKAQNFDEFMNWAQVLLSDYNDADMNLADTEKLFEYLNEAKAISLWNLDNSSLTDHEKEYLKFYKSLGKYYAEFSSFLLGRNTVYQGLAHKFAAENIDKLIGSIKFNKIIFAGFNALTASEEKIIRAFLDAGKADIFWDAEKYYTDNKIQEAGSFIRKYRNDWELKEFNWLENNYGDDTKEITITGVPLQIGQAEYMGQLLSEMSDNKANSENTAVVLADENLLIPLLYSIPENVKDINITMGYPLSNSSVHSLLLNIFALIENSQKYSSNNTIRFYQKDVINFLNHPYLKLIGSLSSKTSGINSLLSFIKNSNRIFFGSEEIRKRLGNPIIKSIFENKQNNNIALLANITSLIGLIRDTLIFENKNTDIDFEYLFHYAIIINKVRNLLTDYGFISDIKTLRKVFTGLADSTTIPFYGEPLKGLQIMGMLETRTLDFENIILLSANEQILPAGKFQHTFIPYDIRKEMGLSTYKQKESIFAYHFYRLLQRAKNIHIIYNTQSGDFGSGEKSRFITQLCEEIPKYNPKIKIHQNLLINETLISKVSDAITISKTKEIIKCIEEIADKGFSPSGLNTYISCPLRFYFQYIEKIEEPEEAAETIDAATLGSTVHYVLKNLYRPFKNKILRPADIKQMFGSVEELIKEGFKKYYPDGDIETGKNLLVSKVANKFTTNFLQTEMKFIEGLQNANEYLTIIQLEEPFETSINIKLNDQKTIPVKIKGFIDRVDRHGETYRIIDYKTGIVKKEELKFDEWEQLITERVLAKSLQLLTYAYLFNKKHQTTKLSTGIISFRNLSKGFLAVNCPGSHNACIDAESLGHVEKNLSNLIANIFNPDIPFNQTSDIKICENCPYNSICNR
jgi:RecB family exonuclease